MFIKITLNYNALQWYTNQCEYTNKSVSCSWKYMILVHNGGYMIQQLPLYEVLHFLFLYNVIVRLLYPVSGM
jgi:hypothetical protein